MKGRYRMLPSAPQMNEHCSSGMRTHSRCLVAPPRHAENGTATTRIVTYRTIRELCVKSSESSMGACDFCVSNAWRQATPGGCNAKKTKSENQKADALGDDLMPELLFGRFRTKHPILGIISPWGGKIDVAGGEVRGMHEENAHNASGACASLAIDLFRSARVDSPSAHEPGL